MNNSEFCYKLHAHTCKKCGDGGRILSFMHGTQEVYKCSKCNFMRPEIRQVCCCGTDTLECVSHEEASRLGLLEDLNMRDTEEQQDQVRAVGKSCMDELRAKEGRHGNR